VSCAGGELSSGSTPLSLPTTSPFPSVCARALTQNRTTKLKKFKKSQQACFKVNYDVLVLAVGTVNNTFGVAGVEEHAFFFKSIEDASRLRRHVSECFERAALPQTPPEEKERLLSFVVCGGGPTGVEVAAELHDMITEDLAKVRENEK
jgi:NADH dehydrogenase FAD-containing subunit